ncbi:hypothetical protein HMPREF9332_00114 [Alloprevotella rava F0323]|uniref:Uracil-DNA glycosylase-like domain-containing protein n=1 Tax=Alloprevotella rava F0323 TaxID=679199 RepID=G5G963_9BACT|nr:uracil-DNA glycosylase family protein [Alloprevotella rava]EHG24639.1 hypothetical protein HMPREF9332_00114 [Alloprevotella rava F0323]
MTDSLIIPIEHHPLEPFLPPHVRLLMMGSFPPQQKRWSMNFFYPNFINDMWRIFGIIFKDDKDFFVDAKLKTFKLNELVPFLTDLGCGCYDTAIEVRRLQDNASDKFLEVVTPTDLPALLHRLPELQAICTTGQKATDTFVENFCGDQPAVGSYSTFQFEGRSLKLYRMPSSSRAYPMQLGKKAAIYRRMFEELGMCPTH